MLHPRCLGVIPGTFIICGEGDQFCSDSCLEAKMKIGENCRLDELCVPDKSEITELAKKLFTLEDIRKAFWLVFHKSGEVYFDYMDDERANKETEYVWGEFEDALKSRLSWEDIAAALDARGDESNGRT